MSLYGLPLIGEEAVVLPAEATIKQINVEIDGLRQLAATLRADLTKGLRPQVTPVQDALQPGASVGAGITGTAWASLQDIYSTAIQAVLDSLFNLDLGAQAMATAAETIAQDYGNADGLAKARAQDVQDLLVVQTATPVVGAAGSMPGLSTEAGATSDG